VLLLVLPGERGLGELALEARDHALLLGYVGVLYELLGYGGAALLDGEALHVLDGGAAYGLEVEAAVLVEAVVLDGDDRLVQGWVYLVEGDDKAVLDAVELVHDVAVGVVDDGGLGQLGGGVIVELRQALGERRVGLGEAGEERDDSEDGRRA
jgi:hypothetical protein